MANIMALNVARDIHLRRVRDLDHPPRGADLAGVRVYVSDQGHFSIKRSLDTLGFPEDTLVPVPATSASGSGRRPWPRPSRAIVPPA